MPTKNKDFVFLELLICYEKRENEFLKVAQNPVIYCFLEPQKKGSLRMRVSSSEPKEENLFLSMLPLQEELLYRHYARAIGTRRMHKLEE